MTASSLCTKVKERANGTTEHPASSCVVSIDIFIFRGVVMALMIFVNDLASVHGLSIHERRRNSSMASLRRHIALRVLALLVFGLILATGSDGNAWRMHGFSPNLWTLSALTGAVLVRGTFGSAPAGSICSNLR